MEVKALCWLWKCRLETGPKITPQRWPPSSRNSVAFPAYQFWSGIVWGCSCWMCPPPTGQWAWRGSMLWPKCLDFEQGGQLSLPNDKGHCPWKTVIFKNKVSNSLSGAAIYRMTYKSLKKERQTFRVYVFAKVVHVYHWKHRWKRRKQN